MAEKLDFKFLKWLYSRSIIQKGLICYVFFLSFVNKNFKLSKNITNIIHQIFKFSNESSYSLLSFSFNLFRVLSQSLQPSSLENDWMSSESKLIPTPVLNRSVTKRIQTKPPFLTSSASSSGVSLLRAVGGRISNPTI